MCGIQQGYCYISPSGPKKAHEEALNDGRHLLFEHYRPYPQPAPSSEDQLAEWADSFPVIASARDGWGQVSPLPVDLRIAQLRGAPAEGPTIEIAYAQHRAEADHLTAARSRGRLTRREGQEKWARGSRFRGLAATAVHRTA